MNSNITLVKVIFLCETGRQISKPTEKDNLQIWIDPTKAIENLFHEHQRWAVYEALSQL